MNVTPPNPHKPGQSPVRPGLGTSMQQWGSSEEILAELLHSQRQISQMAAELGEMRSKLADRTHQMTVLQHVAEILAATPKVNQVVSVLMDVFVQEYNAKRCVIWILEDGGSCFLPRVGNGIPKSQWSQFLLPAPNPFPESPIVLYQAQWLDMGSLGGTMGALTPAGKDTSLFFIPFEHQLLLMGFAVLELETGHQLEDDLDSLTILQRQVAVSIYNAWLFRDLGEQRDALRTKTGELERANAALREADRFKSEFLALTSHELRTPLTGILGFTRLVLDGLYEDEGEMRQMLRDSYHSGQHLLALLNDILDLAKIESGRMQIRMEPWSLHILVEELKPIAAAYPRNPGVELAWPTDLKEMPEVSIDPGRMKQVVLNVLSNALKFTKEGTVTLGVERGIGCINLTVADTGIGVSPEAQANLFQKFVQADGGHSREYGGTGLGLVICKHLMEMMGGSIQLHSEGEGLGTTITMTLLIA
ncbi:GAF domain-containing sensor histidine kinase [Holophaga foetida]|uniref:GAF domain-containing sensor histidine kinase n=1 Tax=Holophaga foetida TaxID=35839 RepID=UPI0002472EE4|nr:HAMP domain-containing sensor histidine kinase [Holophaga foetida]